jgi:hypothetical protein
MESTREVIEPEAEEQSDEEMSSLVDSIPFNAPNNVRSGEAPDT